jgi:tRNA threonylcarbamoyladenosine biosynthesis protein TsaE
MENKQQIETIRLFLRDEEETNVLAQKLAEQVCGVPGTSSIRPAARGRIHLRGDLGAGKTSFARAFLRAAGVTGRIKSPSYALLESYNLSNLYLYHFDFYRFSDTREWVDAGFRDILHSDAVILIEWPERAGSLLPAPDLDILLEYADSGRHVALTAHSEKGQSWLMKLAPPAASSPAPEPPGVA